MLEGELIQCPQCGHELEQGYMYADRTIKWTRTNKRKLTNIGDVTLVRNYGFFMKKLPGLRCAQCGMVLFQYDPEELV